MSKPMISQTLTKLFTEWYSLKYNKAVGVYINTMKWTFLFKFRLLTSLFLITSLQVNKEKLLINIFSLFPFIHAV